MRFSVIVPVYNVEKYLSQCAESVLCQSYKNFELILVDDGSQDSCPAICDRFAKQDSRVKVVHKKNGGLVSARKAGAKIAQGEYAVAVDGDDWLALDYLEKVNQVIEQTNPDVIRFGFFEAYDNGKIISHKVSDFRIGYYNRSQIEKIIFPCLIYGVTSRKFPHQVWGESIKMELYKKEQLLVPDNIKIGEDAAVTRPIIFNAQSIYVLDDCLYYYRRNLSSMTKNRHPFSLENDKLIVNHYEKRMDLSLYNLQEQVYRSIVHNVYNACVTQFWRDKPYNLIKRDILNALNQKMYHEAIMNAHFDAPLDRKIMLWTMKNRYISLMWLFSKIKRF